MSAMCPTPMFQPYSCEHNIETLPPSTLILQATPHNHYLTTTLDFPSGFSSTNEAGERRTQKDLIMQIAGQAAGREATVTYCRCMWRAEQKKELHSGRRDDSSITRPHRAPLLWSGCVGKADSLTYKNPGRASLFPLDQS